MILMQEGEVFRYPLCGAPEAAREPVSASLASIRHGERPGKCRSTELMSKGRPSPKIPGEQISRRLRCVP